MKKKICFAPFSTKIRPSRRA